KSPIMPRYCHVPEPFVRATPSARNPFPANPFTHSSRIEAGDPAVPTRDAIAWGAPLATSNEPPVGSRIVVLESLATGSNGIKSRISELAVSGGEVSRSYREKTARSMGSLLSFFEAQDAAIMTSSSEIPGNVLISPTL